MCESELKEKIRTLEQENEELKQRVITLETMIKRGSSGNTSAYTQVRAMIVEKVRNEVPEDINDWRGKDHKRIKAERKVMDDLKWDLRIRTIADFRTEHIEPAKEYIEKYKIDEFYKNEGGKENE